jgi:predicted flap endonuclease-1-like 5' DNA nuclease
MSSVLSTVLITAPVAFLLGWLLSKAVFKHLSVTRPNPGVSRGQQAISSADSQLAEKATTASQIEDRSAHSDTQLLKEAIAERDHLITTLKQQIASKPEPLEDTAANATAQEGKLRETVKALREGLTTKEKQLNQLKSALHTRDEKSLMRMRLIKSGRTRVKSLAKKIRQQKLILSELRDELRQRELQQRELEARRQTQKSAPQKQAPEPAVSNSNELRALQGVGPAMQIKLNEKGICRLKQLAEMDATALTKLGTALSINPSRLAKIDWAAQARQLLKISAPGNSPAAEKEAAVVS